MSISAPTSVVYLGGWVRSGTTLLCELLGASPDAVAVGEVSGTWGALRDHTFCSCGVRIQECALWRPSIEATFAEHALDYRDSPRLAELAVSVLETRRSRHLRRLSDVPVASWPPHVKRYRDITQSLFLSLMRFSGGRTLIDSSKLPPGYLFLKLMPSIDSSLIHILRDPRAVANSELRTLRGKSENPELLPPGKGVLKSAAYWSYFNLALWRHTHESAGYQVIRYEDLAQNPGGVVAHLAKQVGIQAPLRAGQLDSGHVVVGNPSRLQGSGRAVRADTRWKDELSPGNARLVGVVTWPAQQVLRRGLRASRED